MHSDQQFVGPISLALPVASSGISSVGASEESAYVSKECYAERENLERTESLGRNKQAAYQDLCEVADECREPKWAGHASAPVLEETYRHAYSFLEALPSSMVMPEAGAEPDGHLTLEWYKKPRHVLSLSISPDSQLYYASMRGNKKQNGAMPFFGDVPEEILALIHKLEL